MGKVWTTALRRVAPTDVLVHSPQSPGSAVVFSSSSANRNYYGSQGGREEIMGQCEVPPVLREWGPEGKTRLQQREMGRWPFLGEGKEGARSTFPGKHEERGSFSLMEMQAAVWE